MTFLPIVERELRAAARRKSTYRIRSWTTLIAMLVCFCSFFFVLLARGAGGAGNPLFSVLTWYAFGLSLLAGVFLTADALSQEKREGTLGLLFLTHLKGHDVVLGKFIAMSLNAFYGLFALLPVTALPMLLGGVTGAEFWRTALALLDALFVSLAAGVCVSVFMRDAQRAMGNTLLLVLLLAAVLPALAELSPLFRLSPAWARLAWVSPFYPFAYAPDVMYRGRSGQFWGTLLGSHLFGWALLGLASWTLPRIWQEKTRSFEPRAFRRRWWQRRSGSPERRAQLRAELLGKNPVMWLMSREAGFQWGAWAVVLTAGVVMVGMACFAPLQPAQLFLSSQFIIKPSGFLLKMLFALQACRFFAEGRRNGSLELLLCTPLTNHEVIRGQTMALWKNFLRPLVLLFLVSLLPVASAIAAALANRDSDPVAGAIVTSASSLWYCLYTVADIFAICWFGMWLALSLKRPQLAPALTILFVLILPSMLCALAILADIFFISYSYSRLQQDLRRLIARQYQQTFASPALQLSAMPPRTPPVIAG